ncbi:nucleotidyltransferase family protein [Sphingobium sp. CAP-1]|uniref:nucleotidyltransferase family protein n=1 Tax=Sphingobium sp. CAP-1 TaxID=2676077 RepID=UPI0012BB2948|nr:nucleotidyltransferase domain-containing protein [Sphingobium sp. CAP-1]QGP80058.1 DNA polymerase beta [Sphingobium sp. CAP-1]
MTREEAIARIKPHEAELRAAGIISLALFGSVARGEAHVGSDVDLMCEIDQGSRMGLIEFAGVQLRLEDFMQCPVDLVERAAMRPRIRASAETDMVAIF